MPLSRTRIDHKRYIRCIARLLLLLLLLALASFFATYNLITTAVERRIVSKLQRTVDDLSSRLQIDPVVKMPKDLEGVDKRKTLFHIALTATDGPYSQWQCRIMYYWYKKQKDLPGSDMGRLTRILHSGKADNLMDEIPTFVVDPLPEGLDQVRYLLLSIITFFATLLS